MQVAVQRLNHDRRQGDSSGFRRSRRPIFGQTMYLLALQVSWYKIEYLVPSFCTAWILLGVTVAAAHRVNWGFCVTHLM